MQVFRSWLLILTALSTPILAADGDPEPGFGTNGRVTLPYQWNQMHADSSAGTIVPGRAGLYVLGNQQRAVLTSTITRLRSNGTPDESFAPMGTIAFDILFGFYDAFTFNDMTMDPLGRLIVAGTAVIGSNRDFLVCRLNADGSLDTGFGGMGFGCGTLGINLIANGNDLAMGVAIQPNGRIVVSGKAQYGNNAYRMAVARFTANGVKDLSFGLVAGSGFTAVVSNPWTNCEGNRVAVDSMARIVVGGSCGGNPMYVGDDDFAVARLLSDGKLDTGFSGDGQITISFDLGASIGNDHFWSDTFAGMGLRQDDSIVVAGNAQWSDADGVLVENHLAMVRLDNAGTPDGSFGPAGRKHRFLCDVCENTRVTGMTLLPNGRMLVGGHTQPGTGNTDFFLTRLGSDGNEDPSFANGDVVYAGFDLPGDASGDESATLSLHHDSALISGARGALSEDTDAAILRFQGDTLFKDGLDWKL